MKAVNTEITKDELQVLYNSYHFNPIRTVATFSLMPTTYTVDEDVGDAVVVIECTGGNLTFNIEVMLETVAAGSTATGIHIAENSMK